MIKKTCYTSRTECKGSFQQSTSRDKIILILLVQVLALNKIRLIFFPWFGSEIGKKKFNEKFSQSKFQLSVTKISKSIKNCRQLQSLLDSCAGLRRCKFLITARHGEEE